MCWGLVPAVQAGATEKQLPFYSRVKKQNIRGRPAAAAVEETREIIAAEGGDATSLTADVSKAQDMKSLVDAAL